MSKPPFQSVTFEWLSESGDPIEGTEQCDFAAPGRVNYAMPPECGKGHYEALELTLGMNFVQSRFDFSPMMLGRHLPVMEVNAEYLEPSVRIALLRGLHGSVKVEHPSAHLTASPGNDIFHYTTKFRAAYVADATFSGDMISFSVGRTVLNQLIGDEVTETLLAGLGIAKLPSITVQGVPLYISEHMFNAVNTGLSGPTKKLFCQAKVLEYLAALVEFACASSVHLTGSNQRTRQRAEAIKSQLMASEGKLPTLDELAKQYSRSAKLLNEEFSREFGKSIYTFIMDHRLAQAHAALQNSSISIKQLAARLGYAHVSNFTIAFKRYFGYPPGSLRRK